MALRSSTVEDVTAAGNSRIHIGDLIYNGCARLV